MIPATRYANRRLRRLLAPRLIEAAALPGADRYRKHFSTHAHLQLLLFHGLSGSPSLRQTHSTLDALGWDQVGLDRPISRSQIARSSTSRPIAPLAYLFASLVRRTRSRRLADADGRDLQRLQIVDSSFLQLSAALCPWSRHGGHAPGVRLHLGFDLATAIPTDLHLTLTDTHDIRALAERDLTDLAGWTLLLDRGYYGHRQFARLRDAKVHFIVRQHDQARITVTAERPLPAPPTTPDGDHILADQLVTVGSPNHRASTVVPGLRLVTTRNPAGVGQRFLTSRLDLPATTIAQLYRKRWQIELFFRWLKHHLGLTHPLGWSPAALWLSVLLSACIAILAMLIDGDRPPAITRVAWLRPQAFLLLQQLNSS